MKNFILLCLSIVYLAVALWVSDTQAQESKPASNRSATIKAAAPDGFLLHNTRTLKLDSDSAYAAFVDGFSNWYDASHSYSSKASNLSLDLKKQCMFEQLPNRGLVRHMEIVFHQPGKMLRLTGGLGPLQGMGVSGSMTFTFFEKDGESQVAMDYAVSGAKHLKLDAIAGPVDRVLSSQLDRFQKYCQTLSDKKKLNGLGQSFDGAQDVSELTKKLQAKLDKVVNAEKFPGATLAVVLKDGTSIDLAGGVCDPDEKPKMPVGARMFCGSTGKTYVSAIALQLVAEGKLDLDRLAIEYYEDEKDRFLIRSLPNGEKLTIKSLMNHTSGMPRYLFQDKYIEDLKSDPMRFRSPIEGLIALHLKDPLHAVGEGWFYSDSNYLLLGKIIEKVSGKKYYDLANERLLKPLKLTDTIPSTQPKLDGLVQGHIGTANMFDLPAKTVVNGSYVMNPAFEWCGGGYVTSAGDLAKWLQALHSGKVLNEQMHNQLVQPVEFKTGQPAEQGQSGYGLGSFVWATDNGLFYGHAGIMPGYLTQIEYSAADEFSIALQVNTDEGLGRQLHEIVQEIASIVVENH